MSLNKGPSKDLCTDVLSTLQEWDRVLMRAFRTFRVNLIRECTMTQAEQG